MLPRHACCIGKRVFVAEVVGGKGTFVLWVGQRKLQRFGKGIDVGYRDYKPRMREAYRFKGDGKWRVSGCGLRARCFLRGGVAGKEKECKKGEGNEDLG